MRYLIFMDGLRANAWLIVLVFLFCLAGLLIWAPRMSKRWRRKAARTLGIVLLGLLTILSIPLLSVAAIAGDPPRQHIGFASATGSRAALLSHSSFRDGAATQITVKGNSCCRRYIAYNYYGDGDDYRGATSVRWLDDHHLAIRYARDPSGVQECHSQVGDVMILCDPQPDPFPIGKSSGREESSTTPMKATGGPK
jgi:hypothetical protein